MEEAVKAVKFAVNNVPTLEENAAFKDYRTAAVGRVENAFNEALYRETERAEGAKLVEEGKQAVAAAVSYAAVDGISAEYIAKIHALKTDAQWQEEENTVVEKEEDKTPSTDSGNNVIIIPGGADDATEEKGCGSAIMGSNAIFGALLMTATVAIMMNKKKVGKQDEQ